jgi:nucleotide-binding universal stress UspA family protein
VSPAIAASLVVLLLLLAGLALIVWRRRNRSRERMTPSARRILFPFLGDRVSTPVLDAALRIARVESATLVPAYIATVPLQLNLDAPIVDECSGAMPLLELVEQRGARVGVPVDSRIETGRTPRHALRRLFEHERFDRLVVAAGGHGGFSAEDIAWLLETAPGEILVLRPAKSARGITGPSHNGYDAIDRELISNGVAGRRMPV